MEPRSRFGPGLVVAGVGRSGTSIATRLAVSLGLRPPKPDDLEPANEWNESGYWESRTLMHVNDELLAQWSATWWTPPRKVNAELLARLDGRIETATERFTEVFGQEPGWVWKEPRLTVLLPFWDRVLGENPVVVPYREPYEVAASIAARDGLDPPDALAVWERHTRLVLAALPGRPVLFAAFARLRANPVRWCADLHHFCAEAGLPVKVPDQSVVALVHSGRRRPVLEMTNEQKHLDLLVKSLDGAHGRFAVPDLPPESVDADSRLDRIRQPKWLA